LIGYDGVEEVSAMAVHGPKSTESSTQRQGRSRPMSVTRATKLYTGQWILMQVTKFDDTHIPAAGYVIAHSFDRKAISAALAKEPKRSELPPDAGPYHIFQGTRLVRSGPEYRAAVAQFFASLIQAHGGRRARRRR
jgi:hypothetical protein